MNTLKKLVQNARFRDTLDGTGKTADHLGKFAPVLNFFFPGSVETLKIASALISAPAQLLLTATEGITDDPPTTRDRYDALYTAVFHRAFLEAIEKHFKGIELPEDSKLEPEHGLPSMEDAEAAFIYDGQKGRFQDEKLAKLYEERLRCLFRFSVLDEGETANERRVLAIQCEAEANFKLLKQEPGIADWIGRVDQALKIDEIAKGVDALRGAVTREDEAGDSSSAAALLNSMPTDRIPEIAAIPKLSRFPYQRNKHFVGRTDELLEMAKVLKGSGALAVTPAMAATGMGGIGKTQLAVAFLHRFGRFFAGGVFWLNMEHADQVSNEVLACGDAMGLTEELEALPERKRVGRVLQEWQGAVPRLLVFDNCEDVGLFKKWTPVSGGCRVLVTSRMQDWERKGQVPCLPIATLPRERSLELLIGLAPRLEKEPETADAIAKFVGDLPLALHLAGSYLATFNLIKPSEYLEELRNTSTSQFHSSLEGEEATWSPTQHDVSVGRTYLMSWGKLDRDDSVDQLAFQILACAIWFSHGVPIPRWLLLRCAERDEVDSKDLQKGLNRLLDLGLLSSVASETVQIHNLVAAFVKHKGEGGEARKLVEEVIQNEARKVNDSGDPRAMKTWVGHALEVTDSALRRQSKQALGLANNLGFWFSLSGQYWDARPYFEQALAIRKEVLGENHPDTASSLNNLGGLLHSMGELKAARPYYEEALVINQKVLGENHLETSGSLNNFGYLLQAMGKFKAAWSYYEKALTINRRILGENHLETARSLNNFGGLLYSMGELKAARPYYEEALAIRKEVLGENHPGTASSLNNLGGLLHSMGELKAARPYYEQALAVNQKVLGENHPDTARSLNNLGHLLQATGDLKAAWPYFEEALAIRKEVLGENHPETTRSLNSLGYLLQAMGELKAARPFYEEALAIRKEVLGENHPDTASSLNNLGGLLHSMGELKAARPYYEEALAIRKEVLGEKHPDTALSLNNLGFLFKEMGELEAARPYLEKALKVYLNGLGSEHPITRLIQGNLNNLIGLIAEKDS